MKKSVALGLVVCLIMLSSNLLAKERRGADVIVTKRDGVQTSGELIAVKPDSLLLQNTEGRDDSVDVAEVREIRVVKESKGAMGALIGLGIGAAGGGIVGHAVGKSATEDDAGAFALAGAGVIGLAGLIIGWGFGAVLGIDKTIQFEGMTDSELTQALIKLRKKARIRDFQ